MKCQVLFSLKIIKNQNVAKVTLNVLITTVAEDDEKKKNKNSVFKENICPNYLSDFENEVKITKT